MIVFSLKKDFPWPYLCLNIDGKNYVSRKVYFNLPSRAVSGESTTAIYESEKLKKHFDMLQHFLKMDVNLEKQALFALQDFVHSLHHPPGILLVGYIYHWLIDESNSNGRYSYTAYKS